LGFSPVNGALTNSKAAPAALDGPSHSSAVIGSTRSTRTFGSFGPPDNQSSSVFFQISFALAVSRVREARPAMER